MEEILASIRRIIADDDASKPAKAPEPAAPKLPPAAAVPPPPPTPAPPAVAIKQVDVAATLVELEQPKAEARPNFESRPEPVKPPPAPPAPDVLDLTEAMAAPSSGSNFRTIDGSDDIVFAERAPEPLPAPEPPPPPAPPVADRSLISNATAAAVDSAFNSLAATVLGKNARTLEDLVKEMLRPMLKSWLDDNLPSLVERIVRAEIERVSRGKP